jgi:SAM-dependent methyltransferase
VAKPAAVRGLARAGYRVGFGLLTTTKAGRARLFTRYYRNNRWGDAHSVSGRGSNLEGTEVIRQELPGLLARHGIRTLLDVPCGDGFWMRQTDLCVEQYIGADIVPDVISTLTDTARDHERYLCADVTSDPLPRADAVLCRDLLVHLSYGMAKQALRNMKSSGATHLATTTFPGAENVDISTGMWRKLDLEADPFCFPPPLEQIVEDPEKGKALGLWSFSELPL